MTRILVTCCLGAYLNGTLDCLRKEEELYIVGTDIEQIHYNRNGIDKFYRVPRCDAPEYINVVIDICKKERIDLVMPFYTGELELFLENEKKFLGIGTKVHVTHGNLRVANDKKLWAEFFEENGIPTPSAQVVETYDQLASIVLRDPQSTYCLKQGKGCGGRGFRIIGEEPYDMKTRPTGVYVPLEETASFFGNGETYLVQKYLSGKEYGVDVLCEYGDVICGIERYNESVVDGVNIDAEIIEKDHIYDMCVEVCRLLHLDGNVGFDVKVDEYGNPFIIDINPRYTATISLSAHAGLNLAYYGFLHSLGRELPAEFPKERIGARIERRLADYFS